MAILEIKALSKQFSSPSGEPHSALSEVSLEIKKGAIQGIIGKSGAGKSTLMRCLVGLEKPSTGEILFQGENIVAFSDEQLRKYRSRIGMVFQHFHLFSSRTAGENIAYPMEIHGIPLSEQKARVAELLEMVHLSHKKDVYPAHLSGGEKQRIGIARALAIRPDILFCDEATSALDPTTMLHLLELLQELNQRLGVTIVAITHQLEVIKQICGQVAVLHHGEIVEQGSVAELFNAPKHPATRQLLQSVLPTAPEILAVHSEKDLYRLNFKGDSVKQPVISQMLRSFDVEVNILQANIDSFQKMVFGFLLIELIGTEQEKERALQYLHANHVHWEKAI